MQALEQLCRLLADPKRVEELPEITGLPGTLLSQFQALLSETTPPRARVPHSGKLLALARALEQGEGDQRPARELTKLIETGELPPAFERAARQLLARRALDRGDLETAQALAPSGELGSKNALRWSRARAAIEAQDLREAAEILRPESQEASVEQRRAFARVQRARGDRHAALGDLERALEYWKEACRVSDEDPDLIQNLAITTEKLIGEAAALPLWSQLAKVLGQGSSKASEAEAPRLFEAEKQLARLLMRQRSPEAVTLLDQLAGRARHPERILDNLVEQLLMHERPGRAVQVLKRTIQSHGATAQRHTRLALALMKEPPLDPHTPKVDEIQTQREEKILEHLRTAVELAPDDEKMALRARQVTLEIIERREDDGRFEGGLELVNELLHANPEGTIDPAQLLAARLEFRVGHETLAQGMLESYAASEEGPETWLQVADQYLELAELREASRCFEEARKRQGSPEVLGRILVAYLEHGYDQVAKRWSAKAASIRPSELTHLIGRVRPLAPELAWDLGQRALRNGGNDPVLHLHLARAALARRDKGSAVESCAAGRSLLEDDPRPDRTELLQAFDQVQQRLDSASSGRRTRGVGPRRSGGRRR